MPPLPAPLPFSGSLCARGFLFDLDGTIIDSGPLFEATWTRWANRNGIDPAAIMAIHHGRKIPDTIRQVAPPGFDVAQGEREVLAMAMATLEGLRLVPGADVLLHALPAGCWGIVTSSYPTLTRTWLDHFGLPQPEVLITSQDVTQGKPHPEGYRKGASALGLSPEDCIVFEDAPAGIRAAEAAGCTVITIATMLSGDALASRRWVADFTALRLSNHDGMIEVHAAP